MNSKLYVGNLSFQTNETELEDLFTQFGEVKSVKIIMDRETGRSRGFGFVEMGTSDEAQLAIDNLNGKESNGRNIRVNLAQEKSRDNRRSGGRGPSKRW